MGGGCYSSKGAGWDSKGARKALKVAGRVLKTAKRLLKQLGWGHQKQLGGMFGGQRIKPG